ncbi:MAG: glucokinase [Desulfobacterales bacterium]
MTASMDKTLVLAGDIGGTKTNLGLFSKDQKRPVLEVMETFSSPDAPGLEHIIHKFLHAHPATVSRACFGVAGPVIDGESKTTNLPWDISQDRIKRHFSFQHIRIINDLVATAMSIPLLNADEFFPLNQGESAKGCHLGLVAPGTGLGIAMIVHHGDQYVPISSEGGHSDFAPNSEPETQLWQYLHRRYGHVSIERVVSGTGLVNIYEWLKDSDRINESEGFSLKLKEMDPAVAITDTALENRDSGCVKALEMFVSIFGAVAGDIALFGLTTGGIFLGGGIPPKILPKLKEDIFMKAFVNKGRFKDFLEKIPVKVILNDKAALVGAAHCALGL